MGILSFAWYTGRDSNPQPSEPESDALSIEPPVHFSQPSYYSNISRFCKEEIFKILSGFFCNLRENSCFPGKTVL